MITPLQILSKVILTKDNSIIENNLLTIDFFPQYESEYEFLQNHIKEYGCVPDKITFLSKFPDIEIVECEESDKYLIDTIKEEHLYQQSVPILQKAAEILKTNSNDAVEYLFSSLKELQPSYKTGGTNIISQAEDRYNQYVEMRENPDNWFFTTGFPELDDIIQGIRRNEEFLVLFARLNQGKSWILEKICTHIWEIGYNVGYISPEMSENSIGFRFDTLHKNFSNKALMWGKDDIEDSEYKKYIDSLKERKNKFMVATPQEFNNKITVSVLRNWIKENKLDLIAIDGIKYLTDERKQRGDSLTISLTNISEDLMSLSRELCVPVLVVVQAHRGGVIEKENGTPEMEHIRDSDGIGHNASTALAIRQLQNGVLEIGIKKNRFGFVGGKLLYQWDVNKGIFTNIPSYDDNIPREKTERKVREIKKQYQDKTDIF